MVVVVRRCFDNCLLRNDHSYGLKLRNLKWCACLFEFLTLLDEIWGSNSTVFVNQVLLVLNDMSDIFLMYPFYLLPCLHGDHMKELRFHGFLRE